MKFSVAASSLLLLNLALASPILLEPTHPPALAARDPQGPGSNNNNCQAPNGPCRLKEREPQNSGPGGPGDGPGGLRLKERDPQLIPGGDGGSPPGIQRLKERDPQLNPGGGAPGGDGGSVPSLKERDPEPQGPGSNNNNCQAPNGPC